MDAPKNILVVEDNDFVRMQMMRFLEQESYGIFEARDGSSALNVIKSELIDLIVLDIRMEPMDGFEMIKVMNSQNIKIPVIMVTGDQNPDLLSEAARWHVSAVLMKPVQKDRLIKMVSRALKQSSRS